MDIPAPTAIHGVNPKVGVDPPDVIISPPAAANNVGPQQTTAASATGSSPVRFGWRDVGGTDLHMLMLHREIKSRRVSGRRQSVDEYTRTETEILDVMRAEAQAFLDGDIKALASHWVHDAKTTRMVAWAQIGIKVMHGWDDVLAQAKTGLERYPPSGPRKFEDCLRWENVSITQCGDMAWVLYDQTGISSDPAFRISGLQHELKIFHRVDGTWKIACMVLLKPGFEHVDTPLIHVGADGRIIWMNAGARTRMVEHPGLKISAGKLRARHRDHDDKLQRALERVMRALETQVDPRSEIYESQPVALGESDEGVLEYCWVFPEDGRICISFDDQIRTEKRLAMAEEIYSLSPAQCRLARLLIEGHELAAAADVLDVSINTVRTQLHRMLDKTGVRRISSLVRVLLSVELPS